MMTTNHSDHTFGVSTCFLVAQIKNPKHVITSHQSFLVCKTSLTTRHNNGEVSPCVTGALPVSMVQVSEMATMQVNSVIYYY